MTYGWAVAIIIVAVVVAWQWGLFSFGENIEPGSFGFWGVTVKDFKLNAAGDFTVSLANIVGANVTVIDINASTGSYYTEKIGIDRVIFPGNSTVIVFTPGELRQGKPGQRFDLSLVIDYKDVRTGDMMYRSSGHMWGNYEL